MATARELAEIHGENEARAQLAGLLHDNAKSLSVETMREIVRAAGLNVSEGEQASERRCCMRRWERIWRGRGLA